VNDWYIAGYEPVEDIFGERIGMLYVGVLEAKYADVRWKVISLFVMITVGGMVLALGLGYLIVNRMSRLVESAHRGKRSSFSGQLLSRDRTHLKKRTGCSPEIIQTNADSLQERERSQRAESEIKLSDRKSRRALASWQGGWPTRSTTLSRGSLPLPICCFAEKTFKKMFAGTLRRSPKRPERVRKIVKGLLDFSRQTELDREPSDVNKLIRHTMSLVENQALIKGVSLNFEPGEGLPMITLDRDQMQSVLLNIIINALDATDPGGSITVASGIGRIHEPSGRNGIEILFSDTGCGIPPENLGKLFDPFFTTKDVGQGTGLGLSVSYGIVEHHGEPFGSRVRSAREHLQGLAADRGAGGKT